MFFIVICARRKKRNRKIDRYLHILKESENSFEETCEYMEQRQMQDTPRQYSNSIVGNAGYNTSMSEHLGALPTYQTERIQTLI